MPIAYILWIFFTKFRLCVHSIALFHVESIRNAYMIGFLHSQPCLGGPNYTDLPYTCDGAFLAEQRLWSSYTCRVHIKTACMVSCSDRGGRGRTRGSGPPTPTYVFTLYPLPLFPWLFFCYIPSKIPMNHPGLTYRAWTNTDINQKRSRG